jgi:hypothetical protein
VPGTTSLPIRQLVAVVAIGLIAGYGAFALTAQVSYSDLMPPECRLVVAPGFDLLTGLPHGTTLECDQLTGSGGQVPVAQLVAMSDGLASRRAIPVPLGFAAGVALAVAVLAIRKARRSAELGAASGSAVRP